MLFFLLLPQSRLVMVVVVFKVKFLELTRACTLTLGKAHQEEINLCLSKKGLVGGISGRIGQT